MIKRDTWIRLIKDFEEKPFPDDIKERGIEIPLQIPLKRAISIIGPRRSGKTYGMFLLIKKLIESGVKVSKIMYMDFESVELVDANLKDMENFLDVYFSMHPENTRGKVWFFLDEVQKLERWETFVRSLIGRGIYVYISGSSSKLLSKEIATQLRGRSIGYYIYPLSFEEFLWFKGLKAKKFFSTSEKAIIIKYLQEYLTSGGYPEVVVFEKERGKILKEILEVTIHRDIIERFRIRNEKTLRILVKALASSKEFSIHKFYNFLKSLGMKVSKNTLYLYLNALSDCFLIFLVRNFSYSYKREEQSIPKVYFVDNGLLKILGVEEIGKLMENCVFLELTRRFGYENIRYFRLNNREVDFIVKNGKDIHQLIQACYNIEDFETREREVKALLEASKELKCKNLLIVSWDSEDTWNLEGRKVKLTPLWKWLLSLES